MNPGYIEQNFSEPSDFTKTVANNITEYRNLGELDLDQNAITETVYENGN